ncbi:MAG TPA: Xaa-Pro peptidase family protein [Phycisphaerae bacterium]|nr:Xaa-Pro peptidase family protein [Phycisphaerae bacterium]HNU43847.1 Xaa-Pro peptidase family protein [Phycisphaerae bacterium]
MAKHKVSGPSAIIKQRLARCRRDMKKHGIGAYLLSKRMDGYYLTGFTGEDSAVLVLPREVHVITDGRFETSFNEECPWAKRWLRKMLLNDEIANVCRQLKLRRVAVQGDALTLDDHDQLRKLNGATRLVKAPPILSDMRKHKDDSELVLLRQALRVAEEAFRAVCKQICLGMTEVELAARLEYEMRARGASGPSFPTILAEGPNAALPHAVPGRRKVRMGSALLMDWGARCPFYASDLTRVVFIGRIPPRLGEVYEIVLAAQLRAIAAIRPGARMCDVDKVARDYITQAGYGKEFGHGLGHGLGLDVHEAPSLSWRSKEPLAEGMVVTVEPGIYLPGVGGVRIEDDVVVAPNGCRVLSRLPKNLADMVIKP